MTVYIDAALIPADVPNGNRVVSSRWSHLTADTKSELHAFARKLGLRREWFQDKPNGLWHYDLTEGKRWQAIRLGAVEMPYGEEAFEQVWHAPGREGVELLAVQSGGVTVDQAWREGLGSRQIRDIIVTLTPAEIQQWCVGQARPAPSIPPHGGWTYVPGQGLWPGFDLCSGGHPGSEYVDEDGQRRCNRCGRALDKTPCGCPGHGEVSRSYCRDSVHQDQRAVAREWRATHREKEPDGPATNAPPAAESDGDCREGSDRPRGAMARGETTCRQTGQLPHPGRQGGPRPDPDIVTDMAFKGIDFEKLGRGERLRLLGLRYGFDGYYEFLSNFYHWRDWYGECEYDGMRYRTAEHAFAAAKTLDLAERERIADICSATKAKAAGRSLTLRPDWDARIRFEAMEQILANKFDRADGGLGSLLVQTDDKLLIERTSKKLPNGSTVYWHDQTWGDCDCPEHRAWPGMNHLGRMLMRRRAELTGPIDGVAPQDRWVRIMCTGHRAQDIDADQTEWLLGQLNRIVTKLREQHGMRLAIHGGATGADLLWVQAAHHAGTGQIWAYLPFPQQADRFEPQWRDLWERYSFTKDDPVFTGGVADRAEFLADHYDVRFLHARNNWMIRDADAVVAVIDPQRIYDADGRLVRRGSGTAAALRTIARTRPLIMLDIRNRTVKIQRPEGRSEA